MLYLGIVSGRNYYNLTVTSVTKLGDLLDFGQLFKALGSN